VAAIGNGTAFAKGRDFAAWLGAARQSGWKWSVNLDEKRPAGL
jgi:hypothetical protein